MSQASVLLAIGEEDKPYVHRLSGVFSGVRVKAFAGEVVTITDLVATAKKAGLKSVATTRLDILRKLLPADVAKSANIDNYAGSLLRWGDFEFVILNPLKQLITVPFGEFICKRYVDKITHPENWRRSAAFDFTVVEDGASYETAKQWLSSCDIIGVDIETVQPNLIRCVGYCGYNLASGTSKCFVIPIKSYQDVLRVRELNWLHVPKVLQNGKYDCAYFAAWNCPLWGYFYDTINAYHSWYSELPKDLGSVTAFFVRDSMYWKDMAETGDSYTYYKYNALDCWATVESILAWFEQAPVWAKQNYVNEFTQVPICHMMEMTGIKQNIEKVTEANQYLTAKMNAELHSLQAMVSPAYNPSSPPQTLKLLHVLGYKKAESSDETTVKEASYVHPLNERILNSVLEYRGLRKLISTYLPQGIGTKGAKKGVRLDKDFRGRILYSLNPHGTDTSRMASKEHHFWCGLQIQNIPRDGDEAGAVKGTLEADKGFVIAEADYSQAEARGVAYKSGDTALLQVVEGTRDFHAVNASAFFGVSYEAIFRDAVAEYIDGETGLVVPATPAKTLDKKLRDLSKRTNHGANYNMGAAVMLETMGSKMVRDAQKLLKLPGTWTLLEVCAFLLKTYERTYPRVKTTYYSKIKSDVRNTSRLSGDTGLVRWCFGNPEKSKPALNSYVAHVTQSLNAMILNRAMRLVFLELGMNPNFKLLAQIHDSILFQVRIGHEYLVDRVAEIMTFPVPITDCLGITRDMTVPVDTKICGKYWVDWSAPTK